MPRALAVSIEVEFATLGPTQARDFAITPVDLRGSLGLIDVRLLQTPTEYASSLPLEVH
jgi:hypothetical protein